MANKGKIETNNRRARCVKENASRREKLRAVIKDPKSTPEDVWEAQQKLQKLPKNSSKHRLRNRCFLSGRPRGYYRKFGLSRIALRDLGSRGELPGLRKSSW